MQCRPCWAPVCGDQIRSPDWYPALKMSAPHGRHIKHRELARHSGPKVVHKVNWGGRTGIANSKAATSYEENKIQKQIIGEQTLAFRIPSPQFDSLSPGIKVFVYCSLLHFVSSSLPLFRLEKESLTCTSSPKCIDQLWPPLILNNLNDPGLDKLHGYM